MAPSLIDTKDEPRQQQQQQTPDPTANAVFDDGGGGGGDDHSTTVVTTGLDDNNDNVTDEDSRLLTENNNKNSTTTTTTTTTITTNTAKKQGQRNGSVELATSAGDDGGDRGAAIIQSAAAHAHVPAAVSAAVSQGVEKLSDNEARAVLRRYLQKLTTKEQINSSVEEDFYTKKSKTHTQPVNEVDSSEKTDKVEESLASSRGKKRKKEQIQDESLQLRKKSNRMTMTRLHNNPRQPLQQQQQFGMQFNPQMMNGQMMHWGQPIVPIHNHQMVINPQQMMYWGQQMFMQGMMTAQAAQAANNGNKDSLKEPIKKRSKRSLPSPTEEADGEKINNDGSTKELDGEKTIKENTKEVDDEKTNKGDTKQDDEDKENSESLPPPVKEVDGEKSDKVEELLAPNNGNIDNDNDYQKEDGSGDGGAIIQSATSHVQAAVSAEVSQGVEKLSDHEARRVVARYLMSSAQATNIAATQRISTNMKTRLEEFDGPQLEQFNHILKLLLNDPEKFKQEEFRYLREFVAHVESNRELFPHVMGDKIYETSREAVSVGNVGDKDDEQLHRMVIKGGACMKQVVKAKAKAKTCSHEGCTNRSVKGGVCIRHGAKVKTCSHEGCTNYSRRGGVCKRHGAEVKFCSHEGCSNKAVKGGTCDRHGAKIICRHEGCTNYSQIGGVCKRHGAKVKTCSHEGCTNQVQRRGLCKRHGAARSKPTATEDAPTIFSLEEEYVFDME